MRYMRNPKFKNGDIVIVTDECIRERKAFTAGRPMDRPDLPYETYFEKDKPYKVIDIGLYGGVEASTNHFSVLVEGSSQFTDEKYFELKRRNMKQYKAGEKNEFGETFK